MEEWYSKQKEKAKDIFRRNRLVSCPYFDSEITLNSDGLHHLQFSDRRERNKKEQRLKFSLLPLALGVIRKSGTVQEYRKIMMPVGKKSKRDGFRTLKSVEYWGFVAIIGQEPIKIRVVVRRIGDGKIIFWSVMPAMKLRGDEEERRKGLAKKGLEDD